MQSEGSLYGGSLPGVVRFHLSTHRIETIPHLNSLVDKIREDRVGRVVRSVLSGGPFLFGDYDDAMSYCRGWGLITQTRPVQFANPIYREIFTRALNGCSNLADTLTN